MDIKLSKNAQRKIALFANIKDGWFEPTSDNVDDECSQEDYGHWLQLEESGWEETDQFTVRFKEPLALIADHEAERLKITDGFDRNEAWLSVYEEVMSLFWEEWGNRPDIYKFWQDNIQKG